MSEDMSLKEKIDILFENQLEETRSKTKKMKLPRKAKVKKKKNKQGYIGILRIDENKNITGEKQILEDSTFRDSNGAYHAADGNEIFYWEGKFPVILQPTWKNNPLRLDPKGEKNETFGQKYIMAKMLKDAIAMKKKMQGNIILWIVLGIGVLFAISKLTGG